MSKAAHRASRMAAGASWSSTLPQVHVRQGGMPVLVGDPGPVGAGDLADFPFAFALAGAGVEGPAEHYPPGVLGFFRMPATVGGLHPFPSGAGAPAASRRRTMAGQDSFS